MLPGKPHSLQTSLGTGGTDGSLRQTKDHFIRHQELERDRFVLVFCVYLYLCVSAVLSSACVIHFRSFIVRFIHVHTGV